MYVRNSSEKDDMTHGDYETDDKTSISDKFAIYRRYRVTAAYNVITHLTLWAASIKQEGPAGQ